MKDTVKVYHKGHAYLGTKAVEAGFIGEVDRYPNFHTMTLVRPGSRLVDVKRSLEVTIQDIEMRIAEEEQTK